MLRLDRSTIVVGGTLAFLSLLVVYCLVHLWLLRQEFSQEIANIEPRTSRLLGIMHSADDLAKSATMAQDRLQALVYPTDKDTAATAAALQQTIRELLTGAGMSVSGSQILPQLQGAEFDRLRLDISVEGNIDSLEAALAGLDSMRPLVFVESMKITPVRSRHQNRGQLRGRDPLSEDLGAQDPRRLSARLQLFTLRMKE